MVPFWVGEPRFGSANAPEVIVFQNNLHAGLLTSSLLAKRKFWTNKRHFILRNEFKDKSTRSGSPTLKGSSSQ